MKNGINLLILLFISFINLSISYSQNQPNNAGLDVRYLSNSGVITNFGSANVTSDYGYRRANYFHNGIDLGGVDLYTPTFPIEAGTVQRIRISPGDAANPHVLWQIYVVITGQNGHHFGYMHIFNNDVGSVSTGGLVCGRFVLITAPTADVRYIIINTVDNFAISDRYTGPISYSITNPNGTTTTTNYNVTNQVNSIDVSFVPVGHSGLRNPDSKHLHLYGLTQATSSISLTNPMQTYNPLQYVAYRSLPYDITNRPFYHITKANGTTFYSGSVNSSIPVRVTMHNATGTGTNNWKYTNGVMDIEKVEVLIKKANEVDSSYRLIRGPSFESRMQYGGFSVTDTANHRVHELYPFNKLTANLNGTLIQGSNTNMSIAPHGYDLNEGAIHAYDDFYFSDIYTCIHKNHVQGTAAQFASINSDARYPDGKYCVYAKVTTIRDSIYPKPNNIRPDTIVIDNFRPYVEKVEATLDGVVKYSRSWVWNGSALTLTPKTNCSFKGWEYDHPVCINIYTSEPMQNVTFAFEGDYYTRALQAIDSTKKVWRYQILPNESYNLKNNGIRLSITGRDLAGNPLEGFTSTKDVTSFPVRQDSSTWNPAPSAHADIAHAFYREPFYKVDFVASIQSGPPLTFNFTDQSQYYSESWYWDFGDGTTSTAGNLSHIFATGTYKIIHKAMACNDTLTQNAQLTLLPFISKVEIINSSDTTNKSFFNRAFAAGKFTFSSTENPIDTGQNVTVKVTTSGPLNNLQLTVSNEDKKTFSRRTIRCHPQPIIKYGNLPLLQTNLCRA